jgi:flagellar motor switch/type III secretory pathway protein FliN
MAEVSPDMKADVLAAAQHHTEALSEILSRALGVDLVAEPAAELDIVGRELPELLRGSGLVLIPSVGSFAGLIFLPDVDGITPAWSRNPDDGQRETLSKLALELGKTLLPEHCEPTDAICGYVDDLAAALQRAGMDATAACVSVGLKADTLNGALYLVWPVRSGESVMDTGADESPAGVPQASDEEGDGSAARPETENPAPKPTFYRDLDEGMSLLPPYSRSLLKVKVPVTVTLASTKQSLSRILDLSPGSIIQFDKACDDTLSLEVGGQKVAIGEAVKVGDKFGLWITAMAMPEERFWVINGGDAKWRVK